MLNADLAAVHAVVIVVSSFALTLPDSISDANMETLNEVLKAELATIRDSGSALEVVTPVMSF